MIQKLKKKLDKEMNKSIGDSNEVSFALISTFIIFGGFLSVIGFVFLLEFVSVFFQSSLR